MNIQAIDIVEIGAGGGSIASARLGVIAVGPESASSTPGPACYGRGGREPTVTDANLVLGYLNPDYFAGGTMRLDGAAAVRAIAERVAGPLRLSVPEAAWGIHAVVTSNMELATRVVSIERGRDPRQLALCAFGGSGPVHGCRLAQALRLPRVLLPAAAGVAAALGLLAAEVKFDLARTAMGPIDAVDPDRLERLYAELEAQAARVVGESAAVDRVSLLRSADLRYLGQGYELSVPFAPGPITRATLADLRRCFDEVYAARYGYGGAGEPVEVVTWKLTALGGGPGLELPRQRTEGGLDEAFKCRRPAYFPEKSDYIDTPVYDRYRLPVGAWLAGPAIVEERESTTVLPPGCGARVDDYGTLLVDVGG
jgi:N-methylhydantoinase A